MGPQPSHSSGSGDRLRRCGLGDDEGGHGQEERGVTPLSACQAAPLAFPTDELIPSSQQP